MAHRSEQQTGETASPTGAYDEQAGVGRLLAKHDNRGALLDRARDVEAWEALGELGDGEVDPLVHLGLVLVLEADDAHPGRELRADRPEGGGVPDPDDLEVSAGALSEFGREEAGVNAGSRAVDTDDDPFARGDVGVTVAAHNDDGAGGV